jgi:hypothetical protein
MQLSAVLRALHSSTLWAPVLLTSPCDVNNRKLQTLFQNMKPARSIPGGGVRFQNVNCKSPFCG